MANFAGTCTSDNKGLLLLLLLHKMHLQYKIKCCNMHSWLWHKLVLHGKTILLLFDRLLLFRPSVSSLNM